MSSILEREVARLQRDRMQTLAQQAARIEELEAALAIEIRNWREGKTDSWIRAHMCGVANEALKPQEGE